MDDSFKFRAWDKLRGEYLSGGKVMIQVNCGKSPTESQLFLDGDSYSCDDRMVLEQSTGRKDKNGKTIFIKDILKCTDANGEISENDSDTGIGQVEQLDCGSYYVDIVHNAIDDIENAGGEVEIIGNVNENPELLKEGQK